jgi:hypothetical protein
MLVPMTIDSGMPSSTAPSAIACPPSVSGAWAAAALGACPTELRREAPRAMSISPTKYAIAPIPSPRPTAPLRPAARNAWATSSYATALMSTPAPKAMIRPTNRPLGEATSAKPAPMTNAIPPTRPQKAAWSIIQRVALSIHNGALRGRLSRLDKQGGLLSHASHST